MSDPIKIEQKPLAVVAVAMGGFSKVEEAKALCQYLGEYIRNRELCIMSDMQGNLHFADKTVISNILADQNNELTYARKIEIKY